MGALHGGNMLISPDVGDPDTRDLVAVGKIMWDTVWKLILSLMKIKNVKL